ncbi:stage II sporulation protein M [Bacillus paranthracis]
MSIPFFVVVFNGVIVGETLYTIFKSVGISSIFTGFLPHALPELLSIFLMSSITCLPIYILIKIKTVSFFWGKSLFRNRKCDFNCIDMLWIRIFN